MSTNNPHIKKMDQGINPTDSQSYPDATDDVGGGYEDWEQGTEISDSDYGDMDPYATEGEVGGSSSYVQLNAKQQEVANWLDTQDDVIEAKYKKAQSSFSEISEGDLSPEKKQEMLKGVEKTLRELETELSVFDSQADVFEKMTGINASELVDKPVGENLNKEITKLKSSIKTESTNAQTQIDKTKAAADAKATEAKTKAEKEAAEKKQKEALQAAVTEAKEHIGKDGKEPHYHTTFKRHAAPAKDVMASIANALVDGDWKAVDTMIMAIPPKDSAEILSLVTASLATFAPESLAKIPYNTLETMSTQLKSGAKAKKERVRFSGDRGMSVSKNGPMRATRVAGAAAATAPLGFDPMAMFVAWLSGVARKTGKTGNDYGSLLHEIALKNKTTETDDAKEKAKIEEESVDLGSFGPEDTGAESNVDESTDSASDSEPSTETE